MPSRPVGLRRTPRSGLVIVVLFRLLALLLTTQVSGVVHAVFDVAAVEHLPDDCEDEDGQECPPGCHGCHRAHGAIPWDAPRVAPLQLGSVPLPSPRNGFAPVAGLGPQITHLTPLYRPPRAAPAV